jgi:putative ABC transport system ATP-binding protein
MTVPVSNHVMVEVHNVEKRLPVGGKEISILREISFQVRRGEFLLIVGPSGSGKSTLLNMISGIDRPSAGEVVVLGDPLQGMSENTLAHWRREKIGIIFQFFQLMPSLTVLKNVILPMDIAGKFSPKERRERAMRLLETVGIAEKAHQLPGMISGGEQQRAAIARALANDPPLLVADEPTGNLDSISARLIFNLFEKLVADGKTMLVVTHDTELAQQAPHRIAIVDGRIQDRVS